MWTAPATVRNVEILRARGVHIIGPGNGFLACGDSGDGRMSEPADIVNAIEDAQSAAAEPEDGATDSEDLPF
jgi:phosphopantothenoylcysteine decarboxylase/phosphopantothenate--cysteine ligase